MISRRPTRALLAVLAIGLLAAAVTPAAAQANRSLLSEHALETTFCARNCPPPPPKKEEWVPPPEWEIEGPCGLAISPTGGAYVSDYYHRVIDIFGPPKYFGQIILPGTQPFEIKTLSSVCGLAFDAAGNLYGNELHRSVVTLPNLGLIDDDESTGLAIDPTTNRLFVNDRTYIAEYALPASPGAPRVRKIGNDKFSEGFGLAAFNGRIFVGDAATNTVLVFEPSVSTTDPVATIDFDFKSLVDASLAVDPTNEHLLVVDNTQPGYEHPIAAVYEFAPNGSGYSSLGRLPGFPIFGGPSGIAVTASGGVLLTDGNDELSNAFSYSSYSGASFASPEPPPPLTPEISALAAPAPEAAMPSLANTAAVPSKSAAPRKATHRRRHKHHRHIKPPKRRAHR